MLFSSIYTFVSAFVVAFLKTWFFSDDSIAAFHNTAQSIWLLVICWLSNVIFKAQETEPCEIRNAAPCLVVWWKAYFPWMLCTKKQWKKSFVNLSNFLEPFCFFSLYVPNAIRDHGKKYLLRWKRGGFSFVHYAHILPQSESLIRDRAKGGAWPAWCCFAGCSWPGKHYFIFC